MFKVFILLLFSLLYSTEAGVGTIGEVPKQVFNVDLSSLRLLILSNLNEKSIQRQYSTFISNIISSGHDVVIKSYNRHSQDQDLQLFLYDEPLYSNVVILDIYTPDNHPSFPASFVPKITSFIDRGGNLLVFFDTLDDEGVNIGENKGMHRLAKECAGITLLPQNTNLFDISAKNLDDHARIFSNNCINSDAVFSSETCSNKGVLYRGIGFSNKTPNNELIIPLITACHTCISINNSIKSKSMIFFGNHLNSSTGEEIGLIMSMQARNGARATFSTDGKLCSDDTIVENNDNLKFCRDISLWSFQQRGLLKITDISHKKINNSPAMAEKYDETLNYTVEDIVQFSAKIYKYNNDKWEGYDSNDIQLEFTMLDPYVRIFLIKNATDPKGSTFSTTFKIPDVWGVYKFVINHRKVGYNTISYESITTVRNFRHDQNERFVISALPYYSAFIVTIISFCYFILLFISQEEIYLRKCKSK